MKKVNVLNKTKMLLTLRSNEGKRFIAINSEESHTFNSEKELMEYSTSLDSFKSANFIQVSFEEDNKVDESANNIVDEDIVDAKKSINKEIGELKVEFKASKDLDRKKAIKVQIKKLNNALKDLA